MSNSNNTTVDENETTMSGEASVATGPTVGGAATNGAAAVVAPTAVAVIADLPPEPPPGAQRLVPPAPAAKWNAFRYPTAEEQRAGRGEWDMIWVGAYESQERARLAIPITHGGNRYGQLQLGPDGPVVEL